MSQLSELEPMPVAVSPDVATSCEHSASRSDNMDVPTRAGTAPVLRFSVPARDLDELNRLGDAVAEDVTDKLLCLEIIHDAENKKQACRNVAAEYAGRRGFSRARLWNQYFEFVRCHGDWRCLVNRARCLRTGSAEARAHRGQPREFVKFWWFLCAKHKRVIASARLELLRIWRTGLDSEGKKCAVPGYGFWQDWFHKEHPAHDLPLEAPIPAGWTKSQLYRIKPPQVQRKMAREGTAAARALLPFNRQTRVGMGFLQEVTFDDVKTDWRIIEESTGQVCDLWLLLAIDRATGLVLAYWPLPSVRREDGTKIKISLAEMKQLLGWVFERWGLPPYVMTLKLENATASVSEGTALAIRQLFGDRIKVSFSRMHGGKAPSGYDQRAIGNSRGKAGHESTNNLFHNYCDALPGQTGSRYDVRPPELYGRERHALKWLKEFSLLPAAPRAAALERARFPVLTLAQARAQIHHVLNAINARTEHELEGFEFVWEWRVSPQHEWEPITTYPEHGEFEKRRRKHAPIERMHRLVEGLEFTRVPAAALVKFYETTQRKVRVNEQGVIIFRQGDTDYEFRPPVENLLQPPFTVNAQFLAYFNEQRKDLLHLTQLPPHNGYVATWARTLRGAYGDEEARQQSLRYTEAAFSAQVKLAQELAGDEPARIAAIDSHNAAVLAEARAHDITDVGLARNPQPSTLNAPPAVTAMEAAEQSRLEDLAHAKRVARIDVAEAILRRPEKPDSSTAPEEW